MKKKIIFIIISVFLMIGVTIYTGVSFSHTSQKKFEKAGYILNAEKQSGNVVADKSVKYYFAENTGYKNSFDNKVEFKDTNGDKVKVDEASFVHYNDGSISLLKKGVILNLDEINNAVPKYYNLFEGTMLENMNQVYYVDNLGKKLKFDSFVVRVSDDKILLVADNIKLRIGDGEDTVIKGDYVEVSFVEEGIIRIENQEVSYQTIAKDASILIGEDLVLNLDNEYFFYKDEPKLNLQQIIIDSNDNIDITPLEDEDDEPENEPNNNVENNGSTGGSAAGGDIGFEEEVVDNELVPPSASVSELKTSSTMVEGNIVIADTDSLITGSSIVTLTEVGTGKTIFNKAYDEGTYNIDFMVDNLKPNTTYNLTTRVTYTKDSAEYTMDIVQQLIVTSDIGISIEKDYYTTDSLAFLVNVEGSSGIKSAKVSLYETNGSEPINSFDIKVSDESQNSVFEVLFDSNVLTEEDLKPNTKYVVKVEEIFYNNVKLNNVVEMSAKTLKRRPEIGTVDFDINKKAGSFTLKLNKLMDLDKGIESLAYEVYDVNGLVEGVDPFEGKSPVAVIETTSATSVELVVDDVNVKRNNGYVFRVVGQFYDNEKYIEYVVSLTSSVMNMEGRKAPSVEWTASDIGWEHITGTVKINNAESIVQKNFSDYLLVTISNNTVGTYDSFKATLDQNDSFPIDINYLIADSIYTISITGPVDYGDGNGTIDSAHIGSFMVRTDSPQPVEVSIDQNHDTSELFEATISFEDPTLLEVRAMTYYTVSLYTDMQAVKPMMSTVIKDSDLAIYNSEFADAEYECKISLKSFDNMTEAEFLSRYGSLTSFILKVEKAYDYTYDEHYSKYGIKVNEIELVNNAKLITPNVSYPLPTDTSNAVSVVKIKNNVADAYGLTKDDSLVDSAIVGLAVEPIFGAINFGSGSGAVTVKSITYTIYEAIFDELTGEFVIGQSIESFEHKPDSTQKSPNQKVIELDGDKLKRGGRYYIAYTAVLVADGVETAYPDPKSGVLLRSTCVAIPKQASEMAFYITDSSFDSVNSTAQFTAKYSLSDPDNTLARDVIKDDAGIVTSFTHSLLYAKVYKYDEDGLVVDVGEISKIEIPVTEEQQEISISLSGIDSSDDYYIQMYTVASLYDIGGQEQKIHFRALYEGAYVVPLGLNYTAEYVESRNVLEIKTSGLDSQFFKRIAAYNVKMTLGGTTVTMPIYQFDIDGFTIDLFSIKSLFAANNVTVKANDQVSVEVTALYDGGDVGFSTDGKKVVKVRPESTDFSYFSLGSDGKMKISLNAAGSVFSSANIFTTKVLLDYANRSLAVAGPSSYGYHYGDFIISTNAIESVDYVLPDGFSDVVTLKEAIGVDMKNNGAVNYQKGIRAVTIYPVFYGLDTDKRIIVELIRTSDNEIFTYEPTVGELSSADGYTISELNAEKYAIRFSYKDEGSDETNSIIDLDNGLQSYFEVIPLDDFGIVFTSNPNTSLELPDKSPKVVWADKKISIGYNIDVTSGYDGLRYILSYRDSDVLGEWKAFSYELYSSGEKCQEIDSNGNVAYCTVEVRNIDEQMSLDINYEGNSLFNFAGSKRVYKLEVIPVYGEKDLLEGKEEYYFTLPTISPPVITMSSAFANINTGIDAVLQLVVQVKDPNKVLVTQTGANDINGNPTEGNYIISSFKDINGNTYEHDFVGKAYYNNKMFSIEGVDFSKYYVIVVNYQYDLNNNGVIDENENGELTYYTRTANASGIDFGTVTYSVIDDQFVVYFEDSHISDSIDEIIYIIVDKDVEGVEEGGSLYYTGNASLEVYGDSGRKMVLPSLLQHRGSYYIQANFYASGVEVGSIGITARYEVN